jgi:hypothetical protein
MVPARPTMKCADCVVSWRNPPLLEIVAQPIVPPGGTYSLFFRKAEKTHESVSKSAAFFAAQRDSLSTDLCANTDPTAPSADFIGT